MKKTAIFCVMILLLILFTACSGLAEEPVESVPEQPMPTLTGTMSDYVGWWQRTIDDDDAPFTYLEITGDGDVVCYNKDGAAIDSGTVDYTAEPPVNTPALTISFNSIEDYCSSGADIYAGAIEMPVILAEEYTSPSRTQYFYAYLDTPPGFSTHSSTPQESTDEKLPIPGQLEADHSGHIGEYEGWWKLMFEDAQAPFYYLEIDIEGVAACYDQSSVLLDSGYADYDAQRALNGNPLIILPFESLGIFASDGDNSADSQSIDIMLADEWNDPARTVFSYEYLETPPEFAMNSGTDATGQDAATILMDLLAEKMEGKAVVEAGEEEINGELCKVFQFGVNTPERFEAEQHFAVSPDGDVYTMDILQGPDWIPYTS